MSKNPDVMFGQILKNIICLEKEAGCIIKKSITKVTESLTSSNYYCRN